MPGFALLVSVGIALTAHGGDRLVLWRIVHDRCVADAQAQRALQPPCVAVDLKGGYVVLKDRNGATQFLVLPTDKVTGIEDPAVLAPGAPNYFADAWAARNYVSQAAGHALPDDDIAVAINSIYGRTQDQLHIHVDCLRPDVRAALAQHADAIGAQWSEFPVPLAGHRYRAMRLAQPQLGDTDPFRLLAADTSAADMGGHTLVLAGVTVAGKSGFVLLDDHADIAAGDRASGELLQDHGCALASAQ